MKTNQLVDYFLLAIGMIGGLWTFLQAYQKFLDHKLAKDKERNGKSELLIDLSERLDAIEGRLKECERNEERYLNLLEKLANRQT
jgi:hypothetical protein